MMRTAVYRRNNKYNTYQQSLLTYVDYVFSFYVYMVRVVSFSHERDIKAVNLKQSVLFNPSLIPSGISPVIQKCFVNFVI